MDVPAAGNRKRRPQHRHALWVAAR